MDSEATSCPDFSKSEKGERATLPCFNPRNVFNAIKESRPLDDLINKAQRTGSDFSDEEKLKQFFDECNRLTNPKINLKEGFLLRKLLETIDGQLNIPMDKVKTFAEIPFADKDFIERYGVEDKESLERRLCFETQNLLACLIAPKGLQEAAVYRICCHGRSESEVKEIKAMAELVRLAAVHFVETHSSPLPEAKTVT